MIPEEIHSSGFGISSGQGLAEWEGVYTHRGPQLVRGGRLRVRSRGVGSSVFATCGMSNPTLTIVALALRLAGTLERELSP